MNIDYKKQYYSYLEVKEFDKALRSALLYIEHTLTEEFYMYTTAMAEKFYNIGLYNNAILIAKKSMKRKGCLLRLTFYNIIGLSYIELGEIDKALKVFFKIYKIGLKKERYIIIVDQVSQHIHTCAMLYFKNSEMHKALETFKFRLKIEKNQKQKAAIYNNIACVYNALKNTNKALSNFEKAVELESDNKTYINNRNAVRMSIWGSN